MVTLQQITNGAREFTELATNRRWRANGAVKLWKTRPDEFRLPVKFGLYGYGAITHLNASEFEVRADD